MSRAKIEAAAHALGFATIGFAPLEPLHLREQFYADWLRDGRHGQMSYLARDPQRRIDVTLLDRRFRTIISLAWPYHAPQPPRMDWRAELRGRIAAYALGLDYHDNVLKAARAFCVAIESLNPGAVTRPYVDTGPVFEREWAARGRLGWFGKNTMLLNRERGSYFFLAEVLTDLEFDQTDLPYRDHCGTCRRCLDLCPTHALEDGYLIEPRKCISYLTIENRGPIPRDLRAKIGNWVFGCDVCQEVCPWNDSSHDEAGAALLPHLPELLALDDAAFSRRFTGSAIKRSKRRGLLRNAAVVLGNTGNREAVPCLADALALEHEPLVRSHCAWALGRLGGRRAKSALECARNREIDPAVGEEIALALDEVEP